MMLLAATSGAFLIRTAPAFAATPATSQAGLKASIQAAPLAAVLACDPGTVVLNTDDSGCGSLRQTIADAPVGSTVTVSPALAGQSVVLTNLNIEVTKTVTIDASAAAGFSVDGGGISALFTADPGTVVTFSHISLNNGNTPGYGGAIQSQGSLVLISTTLANNYAGLNGGAVALNGALYISGSTFINNTAGVNGGALSVGDVLSVTRSSFTGNTAANGGAISFVGADAEVVNSLFARNSASTNGDAFFVQSAGATRLLHNTIASPTLASGAAIYVDTGDVDLINTIVASHTIGVSNTNGTVNASHDLLFANTTNLSGTINSSNLITTCNAPYFANPAADDYRITNGSAAINAGTNANVNVDFDGNTRPLDGGFDVGYAEIITGDVAICNLTASNSGPHIINTVVHLTATVSGGSNISYTWRFGDGALGSGATPTHTYAVAGVYTAVVTATNSVPGNGGTVVTSTKVTVSGVAIAGLSAVNDSPTDLTRPTQFTASVTSGDAVVYTWNFGDGATGTGATPLHTYAAVGNYTAIVTASNSVNSASTTTNVTVRNIAIAGLSATNSGPTRLGLATSLTATVITGTNISYAWNFGDGSTGSGALAVHSYPSAGSYTAVVTATNTVNTVTAQTLVTVTNVAPIANAGADQSAVVNAAVQLNGSGSNDPDNHTPLQYRWTQVGGSAVTLSSNTTVSPTFTTPSTPAVLTFQLVITDAFGLASAPDTVVITVTDIAIAGLSAANDSPTVLGNVTHLTASISAGSNVTYAWNFGDGSTGTGSAVSHSYAAFGIYTAVVTATNAVNTVTAQTLVTVTNARPIADAGLDQGVSILAPVQLNGSGSFDPDNHVPLTYQWTQTGGPVVILSNNTAISPTFTAPAVPALLTFTLQVTDALGLSSLAPSVVVVAVDDSPVVGMNAVNSSPTTLGAATFFTASTTNSPNAIYLWNFGDGLVENGKTVSHTYSAVGVYTAIVTATNGAGSIAATTKVTVTDVPAAGLSALNSSPKVLGNAVQFTATVNTGTNVSYAWTFGDGQTGSGANVAHVYAAVGVYTATVTAGNSAGAISATTRVTITDVPILGLAASNDSPTTVGGVTHFTATQTAGSNVSYTWNFGDGEVGAGANPTHTYAQPGSYTVVVIATNGAGAVDATTIAVVVGSNNNVLTGVLTAKTGVENGTLITYTLVVTNASPTSPVTNVMVTGTVPALATLVSFTNAISATGGDYGTGYVRLAAPVTLAAGQSLIITWTVRPVPGTRVVGTTGYAAGTGTAVNFSATVPIYGVFMPVLQK